MLEAMRNQAQSWLAKVILGGIALSFGLWGIGDYFMGSHVSYVAEVDGQPITDSAFNRAYEQQINNYRAMLGAQFSKSMVEQLGLKDDTLQTMINRQLMLAEANKMNLVASDAVLTSYVQGNPAFQQAGNFDPQRYHILTRNMGFQTTRDYEAETRGNLRIDALQKAIIDSAQVSEQEVRAQFEREFEQRKLAAVIIDPSDLVKDVVVDDTAAHAWYDAHRQSYQSKLKVKIQAAVINPDDFAKDLQVDEDEIASAYETRKINWTHDGVTQPLSEVRDELRSTLLTEKSREEAYNLSQDLDNALGMEDSLTAAAEQVGLTVYSSDAVDSSSALADTLLGSDPALRQKAFTAGVDDAVEIMELDDGRFVAMAVVDRIEPTTQAFADVASRVYDDARADAADKKAEQVASELLAGMGDKKPDAVSQAGGYAKYLSKPVRQNGEGDDSAWLTSAMIDTAFKTPEQQWANKAVATSRGLALIFVEKITPGDEKTFAEQKDALTLEAKKAKGSVRFARWMASVRDRHDIKVHQKILAAL